MKKETYKCKCCGGVFEKGWSEEEAREEAVRNFPDVQKEPQVIICDDCYKAFMVYARHRGWAK